MSDETKQDGKILLLALSSSEATMYTALRLLTARWCRHNNEMLSLNRAMHTNPSSRMDPATASGLLVAEQVVSTTIEGGALAAYGLAQSTQPLTATFTRISSDAFLLRTNHSITVVNGQAYIFGGEEEPGKLAGDEVHIVSLPLKKAGNERKPDYKVVPSLGEGEDGTVPGRRAGHSAVAVGGIIYMFGGRGEEQRVLEEKGRVWVFDAKTLGWSYVDPVDGEVPDGRYMHGAAATEHPLTNTNKPSEAGYGEQIKSAIGNLPSLVGKGSSTSPQEPHGSLIIAGGQTNGEALDSDAWIFNIATRTWSRLPQHPATSGKSAPAPSFALTQKGLYVVSSSSDVSELGGEIYYLPVTKELYYKAQSGGKTSLSSADPKWITAHFPANPLTPGPLARQGAGLIPITTGNGREYLLYFLGEKFPPPKSNATAAEGANPESQISPEQANNPTFFSDTWSYQVLPASPSAASIKDATRSVMGISTGEGTWAEVKIEPVVEGETEGKSHPGPRGWFASCPIGKEIDGAGLLIWGGVNGKGEVEGDGWVVTVK